MGVGTVPLLPLRPVVPHALPLYAELAEGLTLEAAGHGRQEKSERLANTGFACFGVDELDDLVIGRIGNTLPAGGEELSHGVVVCVRRMLPQRFNHGGGH